MSGKIITCYENHSVGKSRFFSQRKKGLDNSEENFYMAPRISKFQYYQHINHKTNLQNKYQPSDLLISF